MRSRCDQMTDNESHRQRSGGLLRGSALLLTALTALLAFAGAIGLVGGGTDFGETVNSRLPLDSPVLAGVALAVFVGVPMAVAAWLLYRRSDDDAVWVSVVAGGMAHRMDRRPTARYPHVQLHAGSVRRRRHRADSAGRCDSIPDQHEPAVPAGRGMTHSGTRIMLHNRVIDEDMSVRDPPRQPTPDPPDRDHGRRTRVRRSAGFRRPRERSSRRRSMSWSS